MRNKITKIIVSNTNNPYYNLATEEWAVRNLDTSKYDYLLLYINSEAVVLGKNQNVFQEANLSFCKENNIKICRRISGGGTVYHDLGNLNWAFISNFDTSKVNNYKIFSATIVNALMQLNLSVYLNERNAILIDSYKISGQAQFTNRKNIISHGTLLYDSNIKKLNKATLSNLTVRSKASKSVRSEVIGIKTLIQKDISIKDLKNIIVKEVFNENKKLIDANESFFFSLENIAIQNEIESLIEKYSSNKWIYERSPSCIIQKEIDNEVLLLTIEKASIVSIKNKKGVEINQHPLLYKSMIDI